MGTCQYADLPTPNGVAIWSSMNWGPNPNLKRAHSDKEKYKNNTFFENMCEPHDCNSLLRLYSSETTRHRQHAAQALFNWISRSQTTRLDQVSPRQTWPCWTKSLWKQEEQVFYKPTVFPVTRSSNERSSKHSSPTGENHDLPTLTDNIARFCLIQ